MKTNLELSKRLPEWAPCFANRELGVAFFDELTFETDGLTDPRWDRVLPILEEEQILQCRLMRPLLEDIVNRKGKGDVEVLDLGTGSGVFAIYAAMLGCKVTGVDISQRAIDFAHQNKRKNKDRLTAREGTVVFCHQDYLDLNWNGKHSAKYDVIIVAPPYNPTAPSCHPALHADAGEDGQAKFAELLEVVPPMLKEGGVCLGNHMFTLQDETFCCQKDIEKHLSTFELDYVRILPKDISAVEFIEKQYRGLLRSLQTRAATASYVKQIAKRFPGTEANFSLIYFELTKKEGTSQLRMNSPHSLGFQPQWTWQDRIELHRQIVECSRDFAAIPAEHFLSNVRSVPELIQNNEDAEKTVDNEESRTAETKGKGRWKDSILSLVDQWISNSEFFDADGDFALVLVDSAPWYPSTQSPAAFKQDCAVWVEAASSQFKTKAEKLAEDFMCCYQNNTQALQETKIGPVFHPSFTGKSAPGHWRDIRFTSLNKEPVCGDRAKDAPRPLIHKYGEAYTKEIAGEYKRNTDDYKKNSERFRLAFKCPDFSPSSAATYTSPDGQTEAAAVIRRSSVSLAELKSPRDAGSIEQKARDRSKKLRQGEESEEELLGLDLSVCHQAMQMHLDKLINSALAGNTGTTAECTFLISIPVTIGNFDPPTNSGKIPESFRGGLWVYVVCRKPWSTEIERKVQALCRAVYLIADTKYSSLMAAEVQKSEATSKQMQYSHTLKSHVRLISPAITNDRDDPAREPALAAVRLLQFAVNLFSTRDQFRKLDKQEPIRWNVCFSDAALNAAVRLQARCASESKVIDELLCNTAADPDGLNWAILEKLSNKLNDPECGWRSNSGPFLAALGVADATKKLSEYSLQAAWDDSAEEGIFTYLLTQAFFHGAVYIAAADLGDRLPNAVHHHDCKSPVVVVKYNKTKSELQIANRCLIDVVGYANTTDYQTIKSYVGRFVDKGKRPRVTWGYASKNGWFEVVLRFKSE